MRKRNAQIPKKAKAPSQKLKVISRKSTKFNNTIIEKDGIRFRSLLELYCYDKLNEYGIEFQYEKIRYTLVASYKFKGKSYERVKKKGKNLFIEKQAAYPRITYLPDFVGKNWVIETKGMESAEFKIKWKLFKKFVDINKLELTLFLPHTRKEVDEAVSIIRELEKSKNYVVQK